MLCLYYSGKSKSQRKRLCILAVNDRELHSLVARGGQTPECALSTLDASKVSKCAVLSQCFPFEKLRRRGNGNGNGNRIGNKDG
jgi:hypothetical protein